MDNDNSDKELKYIVVCGGDGCSSFGGRVIRDQIENAIKDNGYEEQIEIKDSICNSLCFQGPIVKTGPKNRTYKDVTQDDIPTIINKTLED